MAVNCGALPDTLLESELFGHVAGAFTDAKRNRSGRFALAEVGTLFLDEIGDVSAALQVRLLRVLEERVYEPLGSSKSCKADVRIIAATNKDLEQLVNEGLYPKDLFYRINVVNLWLPPLSQRREDIPLLVNHFVDRFNRLQRKKIFGLSHEALQIFMTHDWPGNIRELENGVEHAFILCREGWIHPEHLPEHLQKVRAGFEPLRGWTFDDIEKRAIWEALERNQWKRMATARELGIDKNTLRRKILRHRLDSLIPPQGVNPLHLGAVESVVHTDDCSLFPPASSFRPIPTCPIRFDDPHSDKPVDESRSRKASPAFVRLRSTPSVP